MRMSGDTSAISPMTPSRGTVHPAGSSAPSMTCSPLANALDCSMDPIEERRRLEIVDAEMCANTSSSSESSIRTLGESWTRWEIRWEKTSLPLVRVAPPTGRGFIYPCPHDNGTRILISTQFLSDFPTYAVTKWSVCHHGTWVHESWRVEVGGGGEMCANTSSSSESCTCLKSSCFSGPTGHLSSR